MLQSPNILLDEYSVSSANGFLPAELPLARLPGTYYEPWETIATDLPSLIRSGNIRLLVDSLPILEPSFLKTESEWRRAYSVLGFLMHGYIWGGERPEDTIPPSIAKPFLEISKHLGLPPCATYAGLNLWNYTAPVGADITNPDNLSLITSFTGTPDEEWFILISVAIEAKGGKLMTLMLDAIAAVTANDAPRLTALLYKFTDGLQDFNETLKRMHEKCHPDVFFYQLRPLLAGSKNMAAAGLPSGVFYDEGNGVGQWHQYCGGSNGQSSLIQTFDIFLGVNHSATGGISGPSGYLMEMRDYMPAPHKRFLETLSHISNIRTYVMSPQTEPTLKEAYNAACLMLGSFRDTHIQIVSRYIIMPSRRGPPQQQTKERVNLASASVQVEEVNEKSSGLNGTGGTSLIPFLKQTRDTTKDATC
ncbi:Indoleamine 2-3-dioxygenase [Penicillium angulare]|uniref:Indoleamine 2,3-dioxygenase n=1 Tax=Penicillium angulare TaxID=116970 RepID=A0A9W9F477_9EURO|nr:Indoleamine 2-3-dioxygenase [Penicillium angulare]